MNSLLRRAIQGFIVSAGMIGAIGPTSGQPATANPRPVGAGGDLAGLGAVLRLQFKKDLLSQQTNALLLDLIGRNGTNNPLSDFLVDLHLRPKVYQASGGTSSDTSLGVEFDCHKAVTHKVFDETAAHPIGPAFDVLAKGDVAFDRKKNPNNLIEAGGGLRLFQGLGGITPRYSESPAAMKKREEIAKEILKLEHDAAVSGGKVPESVYSKYTEVMRPQLFYDVQAHGKLETDQQFVNKQFVYDAEVGLVFREWRSDSGWGRFNLFDYPFALLRTALRQDEGFRPSGRTFPSVVVGLDQVDPSENKARLAVETADTTASQARLNGVVQRQRLEVRQAEVLLDAALKMVATIPAQLSAARQAESPRASIPSAFNHPAVQASCSRNGSRAAIRPWM